MNYSDIKPNIDQYINTMGMLGNSNIFNSQAIAEINEEVFNQIEYMLKGIAKAPVFLDYKNNPREVITRRFQYRYVVQRDISKDIKTIADNLIAEIKTFVKPNDDFWIYIPVVSTGAIVDPTTSKMVYTFGIRHSI